MTTELWLPPSQWTRLQGDNSWALPLPTRRASRGARGSSDKTSQAQRAKLRAAILKRWGPYCHLCLLAGRTIQEAAIDLELEWPDPWCFTRDHIRPRSAGGSNSPRNQRPAHNICNRQRGAAPLHHARRTK